MKIYNLQLIYKYHNNLEIYQVKNYFLKIDYNYSVLIYSWNSFREFITKVETNTKINIQK